MKRKFLPFINRRYATVSGAAGDFTSAEHLEFLLKAEEMWADGKFKDDLVPHVDVAIKQLSNQTARFPELDDPNKDNTTTLTWIKTCGITTSDLDRDTDICDIDGDELETDAKEYEMTYQQKISFKINVEKMRTSIYTVAEQVAQGLMKLDKELSEWWTMQLLIFYAANAGANIPVINGVSAPFTWNDGDTTTEIPAGSYNVGIIANLIQQMQLNMVNSGWYINRGTLFQDWVNAGLDSGNLDGDGNDKRTKQIDLAFDMWNFPKAGVAEDMFLIDRNAVAMKTYTRYTDKPEVMGGSINQTRYRMKSNILPGVYWDVIYTMKCIAGKDYLIWQAMTKGGIFLNPEPCPIVAGVGEDTAEYTPTGIYSFTKVA